MKKKYYYSVTPWLLILLFNFSTTANAQLVMGWGWAKSIGGTGNESPAALAADSRNGVYVFGHFSGSITADGQTLSSVGGSDMYLIKYDTTGNLVWAKRFGGTGNEEAKGLKTDKSGNLVITGNFEGSITFGATTLTSTGASDVCIVKLQPDGNVVWAKQFTGSLVDKGGALICDDQRNIYTTGTYLSNDLNIGGSSFTAPKTYNVYYCKLDSNGNNIWAKNSSSNTPFSLYSFDLVQPSTLLMHGSIGVITGPDYVNFNSLPFGGMLSTVEAVFTVKINTTGNFISQSLNISGRSMGGGTTLTPSKYVIKAGSARSLNTLSPNALLFQCDTNNTILRAQSYGAFSGGTRQSALRDITTSKNGKHYAVGFSYGNNDFGGFTLNTASVSFLLIELDDTLATQSILSVTNQPNTAHELSEIAADTTTGLLFTAGYFNITGNTFSVGNNVLPYYGSNDIFIGQIKYVRPGFWAYAGNDTMLCAGIGKTIGLPSGATGGTAPYSYSWSPTTGLADPTVASTLATPPVTTSYILTVTDASGNIAKDTTVITVIPSPPTPTIIGNDTAICQGDTVTLTSNILNNDGYYWYNGNLNLGSTSVPFFKATQTGNYILRLRNNATTCYSLPSLPVLVQVRARPTTPTVTPSGPTSFCQGGSVTLASSSASSYVWSTGATTQNITTNNSGSYTVQIKDVNGCKSLLSLPTTVLVNPLPPIPTITQVGNTLTSSAASGNQWYLNGNPLQGATGQNYTYTTGGNYTVTVTNSNGCGSSSAILTALRMADIDLGNSINFYHRIAPNPVNGRSAAVLQYQLTGTTEVGIYITDRFGQQVLLLVSPQQQATGMYQLPLGNKLQVLSNGLYYIVYNIGGKKVFEPLLIQ